MKEDKVRHYLMGVCGKLQVETLKLDTSLQFYGLHHQYRRKSGSFDDKSDTLQLGMQLKISIFNISTLNIWRLTFRAIYASTLNLRRGANHFVED